MLNQEKHKKYGFESCHEYGSLDRKGSYKGDKSVVLITHKKLTGDNLETSAVDHNMNNRNVRTKIGFLDLFSDHLDKLLMGIGTVCMIAVGAAFPVNLFIHGKVINALVRYDAQTRANFSSSNVTSIPDVLVRKTDISIFLEVSYLTIQFTYIGVSVIVLGAIGMVVWIKAGDRQIHRIRCLFFRSLLKQSIGWFDTQRVGDLTSKLSEDINRVGNGLGDKMAIFLLWISTCIGGFTIALVQGWKLTLVILSIFPFIILALIALAKSTQTMTSLESEAYNKAGIIAEEVLSSIKTVVAFGAQHKMAKRYTDHLVDARKVGIRKGSCKGILIGLVWMLVMIKVSLALWYGSKLLREQKMQPGSIIQVFLGVLNGSMSIAHSATFLGLISEARVAACSVYEIINMKSSIDSTSSSGEKPEKCEGDIKVEKVTFSYPTRKNTPIIQNLSLHIKQGQNVAFVGSSGCGKSTIIQLLQRYYDPDRGRILLDGRDISTLNISWLRSNIGVVSQEPVLFATTIEENIRYGREEVTQAEIEKAAMEANAHSFIFQLPKGYNTLVGERGTQLSGGQKQRIAIARALIRNPKILLLDEATSALDNESEAIVQEALNKVGEGRTTIVVAHRLSTIRNADLIIGIVDGQVIETGNHNSLMAQKGLYYNLVFEQSENRNYNGETNELEENKTIHMNTYLDVNSKADTPDSLKTVKIEKETARNAGLRVLYLEKEYWHILCLGCICSFVIGCVHPAFGFFFSEIIGNFGEIDPEVQRQRSASAAYMIIGVAVICFFVYALHMFLFSVVGENLTLKIRKLSFQHMLNQDIGWFEEPENYVGFLTANLASDASTIRGAAGDRLDITIQAVSNILLVIVIAFLYGWKLAIVLILFVPLLIGVGLLNGRLMNSYSKRGAIGSDEGAQIATESLQNIRTVTSLSCEKMLAKHFEEYYSKISRRRRKMCYIIGISFGVMQSMQFLIYAAVFTYASYLIDIGDMNFPTAFKIFAVINIGAMSLGRSSSFAPDIEKSKEAAVKIFKLLDTKPAQSSTSTTGITPESCQGDIDVSSVVFRYPTRDDVAVLDGLSFRVKPGQTVALVGTSGCGKSTTVKLIERFYDPEFGDFGLDGRSLRSLNLQWLRQQIGVVSQEPVLFGMSIRDNIAYGDTTRDVPMDEIIEAAKQANIHSFIQELPLGYNTFVGEKGAQLSGGQKQRIAIARALVRNPKILLLDEATSALDTESEQIVQEALDRAKEGRTSIVIAHRLSTVQNADMIYVIHNGKVVEAGTHYQLIACNGHYHNYVNIITRGKD